MDFDEWWQRVAYTLSDYIIIVETKREEIENLLKINSRSHESRRKEREKSINISKYRECAGMQACETISRENSLPLVSFSLYSFIICQSQFYFPVHYMNLCCALNIIRWINANRVIDISHQIWILKIYRR